MPENTESLSGNLKDSYGRGKVGESKGFGKLLTRKRDIDEVVDEPEPRKAIEPPKKEEYVSSKTTRKVFSDGVEREWDEDAQSWVPLNPAGFKRIKP